MSDEEINNELDEDFLEELEMLENDIISEEENEKEIKEIENKNFTFVNNDISENKIINYSLIEQIEICLLEIKKKEEKIQELFLKVTNIYEKVFPELKDLVQKQSHYIQTIFLLDNFNNFHTKNFDFLNKNLLVTLFMAADGKNINVLNALEKKDLFCSISHIFSLRGEKKAIQNLLESVTKKIAPNAVEVGGPKIIANLLIKTGGLKEMAMTPSCNIQIIGQDKMANIGKSVDPNLNYFGFFNKHSLYQETEEKYKKKTVRLLANGVSKACRVDFAGLEKNGDFGKKIFSKILQDLQKYKLPRKQERKQPLKAPDDQKKTRRGGKRYRKMRNLLETTEVRKMKNRLQFGTDFSEDIFGKDENLGMLGQKNSRNLKISKKNQKLNLSKKYKDQIEKTKNLNLGEGIRSNLIFTHSKAIELLNPDLIKINQNMGPKSIFHNMGFDNVKK